MAKAVPTGTFVSLHSDTLIFGSGAWKAGDYPIGDEEGSIEADVAAALVSRGQATYTEISEVVHGD